MLEALPAPAEIGYILHLSNVQMQPGQINIDSNDESYFWGMMSSARERDRDRQTYTHTAGKNGTTGSEISLLLRGFSPGQLVVVMKIMVKGYRAVNMRRLALLKHSRHLLCLIRFTES